MRKFTLTLKLLVIFLIGYFIYQALFAPVETGKNLESVNWLPKEATNISFHFEHQFGWTKEYMCKIDEKSFRELAHKESWLLKPLVNETVRLSKIMTDEVKIIKGLVYINANKNGKGKYIHYDLDTEMLYYFAAQR